MGWTQEDAGVLIVGSHSGKAILTAGAKDSFIKDVKKVLSDGSSSVVPPIFGDCLPVIPPLPSGVTLPDDYLVDKKIYGDWRRTNFGTYANIAAAFNVEGIRALFPLMFDPISLAAAANLPMPQISFGEFPSLMGNLPMLLAKLEIQPPDFAVKIPELAQLCIPKPPSIDIPKVNFPPYDIALMGELVKLNLKLLELPTMLVPGMLSPDILLPILGLQLSGICKLIYGVFPAANGPNPALQIATNIVLVKKTVECASILIVGATLGSASGGAVGGLGDVYGYRPPPPEKSTAPKRTPREKIVDHANKMIGMSWGKDSQKYTQSLMPTDLDPTTGDPLQKAVSFAKNASSCGMFVRSCLIAAGTRDFVEYEKNGKQTGYFEGPYADGSAITLLIKEATRRGAVLFNYESGDKTIPAFKKGDFVIIGATDAELHAELFVADYGGGENNGKSVVTVGGGSPDKMNPKTSDPNGPLYPSAVTSDEYRFEMGSGNKSYQVPFALNSTKTGNRRVVRYVIDSEKVVTADTGRPKPKEYESDTSAENKDND
jgi:hypothetical protein